MPLCATTGVLLSLADLDSPIDIAADGASSWVPAGWSLKRLTAALWERGYSLLNQGDIDPQSLAGAVATGTHGTGSELGSLSTFAHAFRGDFALRFPIPRSLPLSPRLPASTLPAPSTCRAELRTNDSRAHCPNMPRLRNCPTKTLYNTIRK